ncbi:hypothetical protein JQS43_14010 [Natronosporangium hydrolyticum]|uniref:Uncharacterized protein n=1 Tax=Natronosporangium hydrolyticum TaxID=2811111 RepID=A0A895YF21_9ACTN|nr:hypothetical protein [Natronosporangium hydrolyticum]QSB12800.1 hypothetical protein JQS43_14010 [Natronosporangium hydrolyticum]
MVQPDPPPSTESDAPSASENSPSQPVEPAGLRLHRPAWIAAAVVVAVALVAALTVFVATRGSEPDGAVAGDADRVVSGPVGGREQATFVLLDGASSVTLRAEPLDDVLYRASTPDGGAELPVASQDGDEVRVELVDSGEPGSSALAVVLNSDVQWQIRILGGATEQIIDLGEGSVGSVELAGGASRIELTLPPPQGTTTVRMSEGAGDWYVYQVGDAPVQVHIGAGAGAVTIDGAVESGVAGGTVFTPDGWEAAADRVDIDAAAGVSALVVERS